MVIFLANETKYYRKRHNRPKSVYPNYVSFKALKNAGYLKTLFQGRR